MIIRSAVILLLIAIGAILFLQVEETASKSHTVIEKSSVDAVQVKKSCIECHTDEAAEWQKSHHHLGMAKASKESILAPFNREVFIYKNELSVVFFKQGNDFYCKIKEKDHSHKEYKIHYTIGTDPLQQYMVETLESYHKGAVGKLQVLPFGWDVNKKEWFYVNDEISTDEKDVMHWKKWSLNWNHMCADCHVTHYKKDFDLDQMKFASSFKVEHVSCASCHNQDECHQGSKTMNKKEVVLQPLQDLSLKKQMKEFNTCAPCHSLREHIQEGYRAGKHYDDHYLLTLLNEDQYHHDGQIKGEVFVTGSFLQSKMARLGVRCSHCHDPHSQKLKRPGKMVCAQCHDFKKYDNPNHHKHLVGSRGSDCLECHMPESTYMGVDPRRDHSLRIPRPDLSQKLSTPNACTGCHLQADRQYQVRDYQQRLKLAAQGNVEEANRLKAMDDHLATVFHEWTEGKYKNQQHYGEVFHAMRKGEDLYQDLLRIIGDKANYGSITRATAINLSNLSQQAVPKDLLETWLKDSNALIRLATLTSKWILQYPDLTLKALADGSFSVRLNALRNILNHPNSFGKDFVRKSLEKHQNELSLYFKTNADQASVHVMKGYYYIILEKYHQSEGAFRTAIKLQPQISGARSALANLLTQHLNRAAEAKHLLREEIKVLKAIMSQGDESATAIYQIGIMYYQLQNKKEALKSMMKVIQLDPMYYNAHVFCIQLNEKFNDTSAYKNAVERALKAYPNDDYFQSLKN